MFNSSLTYLDRLNFLFQKAHEASADDDDVYDWIVALEQAHIEVDPRIKKDDQESLELLRLKTHEKFRDSKKKGVGFAGMREIVRPYHLAINRLAHSAGLLMKDADDTNMDDFV